MLVSSFLPSAQSRKIRKDWQPLKNAQRSSLVISGGPSFDRDVASVVIGRRHELCVWAINSFVDSPFATTIRPDYYCISDAGCGEEQIDAIAKYTKENNVVTVLPLNFPYKNKFTKILAFDDRQQFIVPQQLPWKPRGYPSNTTWKAIHLARFMTSGPVFVAGFDYDYLNRLRVDSANQLSLKNAHHHGKSLQVLENFPSVSNFCLFYAIDLYLGRRNSPSDTFNLSRSSHIDFLPKITLKEFCGRI